MHRWSAGNLRLRAPSRKDILSSGNFLSGKHFIRCERLLGWVVGERFLADYEGL